MTEIMLTGTLSNKSINNAVTPRTSYPSIVDPSARATLVLKRVIDCTQQAIFHPKQDFIRLVWRRLVF